MGYFQNWDNFSQCNYHAECVHCGRIMHVKSPRQKTCHRSDNPACDEDIISIIETAKGKSRLLIGHSEEAKKNIINCAKRELNELSERKKIKLNYFIPL